MDSIIKKRKIDEISDDDDDEEDGNEFKSIEFNSLSNDFKTKQVKRTVLEEADCVLCDSNFNEAFPTFSKILVDNIRDQSLDSVFLLMHDFYQSEIKPKNDHIQIEAKDIKNHFLYCVNEPLIEYYIQIRNYKTLREMLFDSMVQANKKEDRLYDFKVLEKIDKINARITSLYKEKPVESLFYSTSLNLQ